MVNFPASGSFSLIGATNPAPIEIAPGWFLTLSGTGNVTVKQVPLNDSVGLVNPTNAPYALEIITSGWTNQPILSQRFFQNGMNWAGKYIASSFTALAQGTTPTVTSRLVASNGAPIAVLENVTLTNVFTEYPAFVLLPATSNPNLPPMAYIDYQLLLPTTGDVFVTSFQIVASDNAENVPYEQDSINRQQDYLSHYYKPKLAYMPIPSYLVGWDFPLNPTQALGPTVPLQALGANTSFYAWDQTIVYQSITNGVSVSRAANGGLTLTSNAAGQVALIQYLEQTVARKILSDRASVHMSLSGVLGAGTITGNVTLWATTGAAPILPLSLISTDGSQWRSCDYRSWLGSGAESLAKYAI